MRGAAIAAVVAAGVLAGCGGGSDNETSLVYSGGGAGAAKVLQQRARAIGIDKATVEQCSGGRFAIGLPDVSRVDRVRARQLARPGHLAFYDWEANVLGADGKPTPLDSKTGGGEAAGTSGAVARAVARNRAARAGGRAVVVKARAGRGYFAVLDKPVVTSADVRDAHVLAGKQPGLAIAFTPAGNARIRAVTRQIAQRGAQTAVPGQGAAFAAQHFAIALDGRLLTVPYVDFQQNPDGIDTRNGVSIQGGYSVDRAIAQAAQIAVGRYPLPAGAHPHLVRIVSEPTSKACSG